MVKAEKEEKSKTLKGCRLEGTVLSDKMDKTIVVKVNRTFKHHLLGKTVTRSKKYKVHDGKDAASVGDWVEIVEVRPISKTKHMMLSNIIRKAA